MLAETAPKLAHVVLSVEYCHVPLPDLLVIAIPFTAPESTSAHEVDVRMDVTVVPLLVVSSFVPVNVTVAPLVIVGASFTLVTVMFDVAVAVLKAVVTPFVVVSTFVPTVPLV